MGIQKLVSLLFFIHSISISWAHDSDTIPSKLKFETIDTQIVIIKDRQDTIYTHLYGDKRYSTHINEDNFQVVMNDEIIYFYSKITPRIIYKNGDLHYNIVSRDIYGAIVINVVGNKTPVKAPSTYHYSGWQNKGHLIFDIHDEELVYHDSNFLSLNKKEPTRIYPTSIKGLDFVASAKLDSCNNERNFPKPGSYFSRSGYLAEAFNNRKTLDEYKITLTKDSLTPIEALKESWYDFHIDKKGRTHAFVYLRGELIYLNQMKPSHNQLVPTSWKEIFSVPATDEIGPFTSVTVKGKQYLFTQNGTILRNTGTTMMEVGKLQGNIRNTSVVWDKEKDKMWYITKEEFDAYKAGDTKIIQQMHEIPVNRR